MNKLLLKICRLNNENQIEVLNVKILVCKIVAGARIRTHDLLNQSFGQPWPQTRCLVSLGGGIVDSNLAFYNNDPSTNPAANKFSATKKTKINERKTWVQMRTSLVIVISNVPIVRAILLMKGKALLN